MGVPQCARIYSHIYVYIYICIYVYIRMYVYIYIYPMGKRKVASMMATSRLLDCRSCGVFVAFSPIEGSPRRSEFVRGR